MGRCRMVIVLDSGSKVRVEDLVNYQGSLMKCWGEGRRKSCNGLASYPRGREGSSNTPAAWATWLESSVFFTNKVNSSMQR